jgi:hypothetical protein
MAARIIKPKPQKVNANLPIANFLPISLNYFRIDWLCEVPDATSVKVCPKDIRH